jgi:uncharacterized membrane protein
MLAGQTHRALAHIEAVRGPGGLVFGLTIAYRYEMDQRQVTSVDAIALRVAHGGWLVAPASMPTVCKDIGACAAAMGGCDAIAFTGGTGENFSAQRWRVFVGWGFLGMRLNEGATRPLRRPQKWANCTHPGDRWPCWHCGHKSNGSAPGRPRQACAEAQA